MQELELDKATQQTVLGGNAVRIFGIDSSLAEQ